MIDGEFEKGPEAEPTPSGKNTSGEPVGLGVPVLPLDPVLRERFKAMSADRPADHKGIVDSRLDSQGHPRPTAQRQLGHRNSTSSNNSMSSIEQDRARAQVMLKNKIDPNIVSARTNLGLREVQRIHRELGSS